MNSTTEPAKVMYRKTALVEAEQFLPPHQIPVGCYQDGGVGDVSAGHGKWVLKTLEGTHDLRRGDYICTGPAGEKWNVEQSIFEATYERVTEPAKVEQSDEEEYGELEAIRARAALSRHSAAIDVAGG